MTSWKLLRHLNIFRHQPIERHPVFERDSGRAIDWTHLGERITGLLLPALALLAAAYLVLTWLDSPLRDQFDVVLVLGIALLLLAPSLAPWSLALGAVVGPLVAGERERQTWVLLSLIPDGIEPVLLAKLRAALWPLRFPLHVLRHVWLVMAFPIGLGAMRAMLSRMGLTGGEMSLFDQVCGNGGITFFAGSLLLGCGMLLYFVDRVQQLLLMALAALSVSAVTHSARGALIGGVTAALLVWLAETAGAALLVLQLPGRFVYTDMNLLALFMLGPVGGYAIDLPVDSMLVAAAITLIVREVAITALWRWSLYAARRIL